MVIGFAVFKLYENRNRLFLLLTKVMSIVEAPCSVHWFKYCQNIMFTKHITSFAQFHLHLWTTFLHPRMLIYYWAWPLKCSLAHRANWLVHEVNHIGMGGATQPPAPLVNIFALAALNLLYRSVAVAENLVTICIPVIDLFSCIWTHFMEVFRLLSLGWLHVHQVSVHLGSKK